ncbi:M23 family metallopeptidase [Luteimonas sp. WGS1318]|uniref:M23 family metallopeptidase n=1 Tax=Luteimonas sp. WGS1318 TaxID=3366815 RepID=UPI00372D0FF8
MTGWNRWRARLGAVLVLVAAGAGWARAHDAGFGARAQSAPGVSLHRRATPDGIELRAHNDLAGPAEVLLDTAGPSPRSDPPLPVRTTIPAGGRVVIARLAEGVAASTLQLHVVPGAPGAQPRDVEYVYPLRGAPLRITQGFGGGFSHTDDENRYAVDFAADEGTPVLAARDGVVLQFESGIGRTPAHNDDADRTNFVRVLHDDGTMALYAHLQRGGVIVAAGERVRRGQVIAFSGNTGASSGPHLHFVVQANRGLRLESLPFRMFGPGGILRFTLPMNAAVR